MKKSDIRNYSELFLTFAKIGLFTFGGGYAMLSIIRNTCVEKKKWITHDEMMDITVIAESTPGPIAINCATYTGYKKAGILGAIAATIGVIIPSFAVIYIISMLLDNFLEITIVANAFKGIKIAVGILILDAAISMLKKLKKKFLPIAIMLASAVTMLCINIFALKFSSVALMIIAAALSLSVFIIKEAKERTGGGKK